MSRPPREPGANCGTSTLRVRRRVLDAINRLVGDPPAGDTIKLQGREDEWRLRVGDWRMLMYLDSERRTVVVLRVLPRGRAYDR